MAPSALIAHHVGDQLRAASPIAAAALPQTPHRLCAFGHGHAQVHHPGSIHVLRIVLVHGTTQSPEGWKRVERCLTSAGHDVHAVDLAGADPQASAARHAQLVVANVPGGRADVVARPGRRAQLRRPVDRRGGGIVHSRWVDVDPTVSIAGARHFLFHDCDAAVGAWALTTLRRFLPSAVYDEVITPFEIPATVIVPTGDRTVRPSWMIDAARHRLDVEPVLLDAGHCPHVSRPEEVARWIAAAATSS